MFKITCLNCGNERSLTNLDNQITDREGNKSIDVWSDYNFDDITVVKIDCPCGVDIELE